MQKRRIQKVEKSKISKTSSWINMKSLVKVGEKPFVNRKGFDISNILILI